MDGSDLPSIYPSNLFLTELADACPSALSPTPPFPTEAPRLRLAGCLVSLVAVSILTTSEMVVKGTSFAVGLGFFGDPIIWRALDLLNTKFPRWQKLLEIRK